MMATGAAPEPVWQLRPVSRKAKSRVAELRRRLAPWNGIHWRQMAPAAATVLFSGMPGPWLLLAPDVTDRVARHAHSRWVRQASDGDFHVSPTTTVEQGTGRTING